MKKIKFIGIVMGCGLMWGALYAIEITPSIRILESKPGEKSDSNFTLKNIDGEDFKLSPEAKDWFILPGNEKFKAEDWLTFGTTEYAFKNGQSVTIPFKIKVPKGACGELVGAASFTMDNGIPSNVLRKMTSVVYVAIKGTEKYKTELVGFQIDPSTKIVRCGVLLKNSGNIHVRPQGWISIADAKGNPMIEMQILKKAPLFPGNQDSYVGTVPGFDMPLGEYVAKISFDDADRGPHVMSRVVKFKIVKDKKVELISK